MFIASINLQCVTTVQRPGKEDVEMGHYKSVHGMLQSQWWVNKHALNIKSDFYSEKIWLIGWQKIEYLKYQQYRH